MNERRPTRLLIASAGLFTVIVFVADTMTPHGVAEWVLYVPIILMPAWFNSSRHVLVACTACSLLVIVGFFLSPGGIDYSWALTNRAFVLLALWLTALAGIIISNRSLQLAEAMTNLRREIAQRAQTEKELREAEERLRLAMQGVGMGTCDANLPTGKEIWSDTHFRLLGYESVPGGEASHDMWLRRVHPDDRRRVLEARQQACAEHALYHLEYRICRPDKSITAWIEAFGLFHYDKQGKAIRFVKVCFDITRRKELEAEVLEIATREQRQIGQELHDGVGQELTGLGLMAQALAKQLPEDGGERKVCSRLIDGLDQVHEKVRRLSHGLIPVHVEVRGLSAALYELATTTREQSGLSVTFECPESAVMLDHSAATQLFRIAQEAVANALRHANARHIRLTLLYEPDGLRLRIEDDGIGIQGQPEENEGLGLRIMKYRASLIGGTVAIDPREPEGTVVTCTLFAQQQRKAEQSYEAEKKRRAVASGKDPGSR